MTKFYFLVSLLISLSALADGSTALAPLAGNPAASNCCTAFQQASTINLTTPSNCSTPGCGQPKGSALSGSGSSATPNGLGR